MKKYLLLASTLIFAISCTPEEKEEDLLVRVCSCEDMKVIRGSIETSIKNANNMSDEEMEDVIYQLEKTYINVTCPQKIIKAVTKQGYFVRPVKSDSCAIYYR